MAITLADANTLPRIDLASLIDAREGAQEAIAKEIARACETTGFFYIVGHGVPRTVVDNAFAFARQFFEQPAEVKQSVPVNQWQRGYMPSAQVTMPGHLPDLKEVFEIGVDLPTDAPDVLAGKPLHGHNQWPRLSGFREAMDAYFDAVTRPGRALLGPFAVALDLPPHQDANHALSAAAPLAPGKSVQHRPAH